MNNDEQIIDIERLSNCCGAPIYSERDICSDCKEHCGVEEPQPDKAEGMGFEVGIGKGGYFYGDGRVLKDITGTEEAQPDKAEGWAYKIMHADTEADAESMLKLAIEEAVKEERERLWDGVLNVFADNAGLKLKDVKKLFK